MSFIRGDGLRKVYDPEGKAVEALHNINFRIEQGEFVSILGPSGCGKSTLLMICAGLEEISGGDLTIAGEPMTGPRGDVGIMFQDPTLLPWKTVIENVLFPARIARVPIEPVRERAAGLLRSVGLKSFEEHRPHQLSGGMRQRVSIARAFANDPEILLMDEPFSALDAQNKLLLQEELLHIWEEHKKTVVFITHSVDEAVFLGDRIMVMTAQPGKVKTFVPVPLARPRNIMELQKMPQYGELIAHIWSSLREEVHRARQQEEEIKS